MPPFPGWSLPSMVSRTTTRKGRHLQCDVAASSEPGPLTRQVSSARRSTEEVAGGQLDPRDVNAVLPLVLIFHVCHHLRDKGAHQEHQLSSRPADSNFRARGAGEQEAEPGKPLPPATPPPHPALPRRTGAMLPPQLTVRRPRE